MADINQAKILIIATDGFEQSELVVPFERLQQAGATVQIASPEGGQIKSWKNGDWGESIQSDLKLSQVNPDNYQALVIPGGQINPDKLRVNQDAMHLVRTFLSENKIVAAICHGPWLLIEADAVRGLEATSYQSIKTDMINAGAQWVDQEVACQNGIVTSRNPNDLNAFCDKIIEEVQEGRHQRDYHYNKAA